jgi:WD40 repeat protein
LRPFRRLAIVAAVDRPGRQSVAAAVAALAAVGLGILAASEPGRVATDAAPPDTAVLDVRADGAAISPDGRRCVTLNRDGTTSLWSCADGERLRRRGPRDASGRSAVEFTRDGLAIVATRGTATTMLDPERLAEVGRLRGPGPGLAPTISPSGSRALRPLSAHSAEIVETASGERIAALRQIPDLARATVVFSGDDRRVAVITRPRSWVTVLDSATGRPLGSFGLEGAGADVDLSADGARVLIADRESVRILDVATGVERGRFAPIDRLSTAAFGVDERLVVTGDAGGAVAVWDTASGAEVVEYAAGPGAVESVALAADGRLLVTSARGSAIVLECPACAPAA